MPLFKSKSENSHNIVPSCSLPETNHVAMGLYLDLEKGREHIVMGEMEEIARYLDGNGQAEERLLVNVARPVGSLVMELFDSLSLDVVDAATGFRPGTAHTRPDLLYKGMEVVEALHASDNLVHRFTALRLWQEYRAVRGQPESAQVNDRLDAIIYPVRFSHREQIERWQTVYEVASLYSFLSIDYFLHPAYAMYQQGRPMKIWHVADLSVLPLYVHCLNTVYTKRGFFQYCKRCGRMYIAHTAKIAGFCGEDCRKAQQKENRQKYNEKVEDDDAERSYRTTYMYWYNRMKKLRQSPGVDAERMAELEEAFKAFRLEATRRKKEVQQISRKKAKEGKGNDKKEALAFSSWLIDQRALFDRLTAGMEG